jgi:hypothetical protein
MKYRVSKEHVWVGEIPDRVGALAEKLEALRQGGINMELIICRRGQPGRALMFISPLRTLEEIETAEKAGLSKAESMQSIRIEGPNVVGLGARITTALAGAGLNLRGYWAAALGDRSVTSLAFDTAADGDRARAILERTLS